MTTWPDARPLAARVALLWRGDPAGDIASSRYWERLQPVVEGVAAQGLAPVPLLYDEACEPTVRRTLLGCAGVLVWVDPVTDGRDRSALDTLLRELRTAERWVSAHPDTIAAIGTKRVLVETQDMGWGLESALYRDADELRRGLQAVASGGHARVLKPVRGNGGRGVWKVAPVPGVDGAIAVQDAARRDDRIEPTTVDAFVRRLAPTLRAGGTIVDQRFVGTARLGMVRAYVCVDRVVGFATQQPAVAGPTGAPHVDPVFAMASAKTSYVAEEPAFATLRDDLETRWLPELCRRFNLAPRDLPVIWDLDFLRTPDGLGYVLCEINVSCVSPFPESAVAPMVACAVAKTRQEAAVGRTIAGTGA